MKNFEYMKYIILCLCIILFIVGCFIPYGYVVSVLSLMIYVSFYLYKQTLEKSILYFIESSDKIIEHSQKHINIIDGEGNISLLSHKLYLLNERFYTLLESLNNEKLKLKDYIDNISHQLKTPITSMRINEEILIAEIQDIHHKELIEKIYIQTNHMNDLVDALLKFAKVESQSIQYSFHKYPFQYLMDHVEDILAPLLIENGVDLIYHLDDKWIICDFDWLSEAIENIIKNCIEASPYLPIDIYFKQTEHFFEIKIHDHGHGFNEEDLPHLLERFYKGKNASKKSVGIGLALSDEIIKGHHGYMEVGNDDGAVFVIHIPIFLMKKKYKD